MVRERTISSAPRRRRKSRRRWWRWLVFVFLLAGLAWWWWLRQPRSFHVRGEYPAFDYPYVRQAGFLIHERAGLFVFRDWQGHELWRLTPPKPDWTGWHLDAKGKYYDWQGIYANPGEDGRTCVTATIQRNRLRVCGWRENRLQWGCLLPFSTAIHADEVGFACDITRLSDDQTLVVLNDTPGKALHLYLLDAGRVAATTTAPTDVQIGHTGTDAMLANGNALSYFTLVRQGARLQLRKQWTVTMPSANYNSQLYADGIIGTSDGDLYQHGRRIYRERAEWRDADSWYSRHSPYTMRYSDDQARVMALTTRASWQVRVQGHIRDYDLSEDGRYMTLCYNLTPPAPFTRMTKLVPPLGRILNNYKDFSVLDIYERPGRLRARLPLRHGVAHLDGYALPFARMEGGDEPSELISTLSSDDGHAVLAFEDWTRYREKTRIWLLRW